MLLHSMLPLKRLVEYRVAFGFSVPMGRQKLKCWKGQPAYLKGNSKGHTFIIFKLQNISQVPRERELNCPHWVWNDVTRLNYLNRRVGLNLKLFFTWLNLLLFEKQASGCAVCFIPEQSEFFLLWRWHLEQKLSAEIYAQLWQNCRRFCFARINL